MPRIEAWIARRSAVLIAIFATLSVALTAVTIYLFLLEVDDRQRLGDVKVVGPCRDLGVDHPECRRQARLIVIACRIQPNTCGYLFDLDNPVLRREIEREQREGVRPGGGSDPSGQPGPPSGGPPSEPQAPTGSPPPAPGPPGPPGPPGHPVPARPLPHLSALTWLSPNRCPT